MDDDNGTLTDAQRDALRRFVTEPRIRNGGTDRAEDHPRGRILLNIQGREISIHGYDRGAMGMVVDDEFRTRIVRDLLDFMDPVSVDSRTARTRYEKDRLTLTWNVALRQQNVTEEDFEVLLDVARSSHRSRVTVDLGNVEDECTAQRTVKLLAAFPELGHMNLIGENRFSFDERNRVRNGDLPVAERLRVHMFLKAFIAHKKEASPTLALKITSLDYICPCSVSPILLLEFFESIATNLEDMRFGDGFKFDDEDVARSCAMIFGRLSSLKTLTFFPALSLFLPFVVNSLVDAPILQNLEITMDEESWSDDEERELAGNVVLSFARLAACSKTLKYLNLWGVECDEAYKYDASPVLLQAAESSSLERLELQTFEVGGSESMARPNGPPNKTVSSVGFRNCELYAGTFELLSGFTGITAMRLSECLAFELVGQWQSFLANHPSLKALEIDTKSDNAFGAFDGSALEEIVRAGHSFDHLTIRRECLYKNDPVYPSLRTWLVESAVSVDLHLCSENAIDILLAGIEGAKRLDSLGLQLWDMSPRVLSRLFKAVKVNKSLRSFDCQGSVLDWQSQCVANECAGELLGLMRLNPRIKFLSLSEELSSKLLPTIVEALRVNRSIEVLELTRTDPVFVEPTMIDNFTNILKAHNTSLKAINGLEHEANDVRERFERYLWENRSGRHFRRNADLVTPSLLPYILRAIAKDTGADGLRYFLNFRNDSETDNAKHTGADGLRYSLDFKNDSEADRLIQILSSRGRTRPRNSDDE